MFVYLHGFNSAPASRKARTMAAYLQARGLGHLFSCPALPPSPPSAVRVIEAEVARHGEKITFVGSSLGGFYATHFAERLGVRAVLINPAIRPYVGLESYLGTQKNLYTTPRRLNQLFFGNVSAYALRVLSRDCFTILSASG